MQATGMSATDYKKQAMRELMLWDDFHDNSWCAYHYPCYGHEGTIKAKRYVAEHDHQEFIKVEARAEGQDAEAQFEVAKWLIRGSRGVPVDMSRAFDYLYSACINK